MRFAEFERLETSRLVLRMIRPEDARDYFTQLASSPTVTKYMLFQPHRELSESVASVEKAISRYESCTAYRWVITLPGEDRLIGVVDLLRFDERESSCSFAYMLGEAYWGRGYGPEAMEAVFSFAFEKMEMERIEADHMDANPASGGAMKKAGMVRTGMIPGKYEKDRNVYDAVVYAITRQEWEKS